MTKNGAELAASERQICIRFANQTGKWFGRESISCGGALKMKSRAAD